MRIEHLGEPLTGIVCGRTRLVRSRASHHWMYSESLRRSTAGRRSASALRHRCIRLLVALAIASVGCTSGQTSGTPPAGQGELATTRWHAGNFRHLPSMSGDIESLVTGLEHPNAGGYGKVSSARKAAFTSFVDGLFAAMEESIADGGAGDWCGVIAKADTAGYAVRRFYDTTTGRWFVYGFDTTPHGQGYFLLNPFAKRNLVIEVPHAGFEAATDSQGVRIFKALAARALLVNKEHRCSDRDQTTCDGSTTQCGGFFTESDVAHHPSYRLMVV